MKTLQRRILTVIIIVFCCPHSTLSWTARCRVEADVMTISVEDIKAQIAGLILEKQTIENNVEKWVSFPNCTRKLETLECRQNSKTNYQYLNLIVNFMNNSPTENVYMWYYDCFEKHGVYDLTIIKNTLTNGFIVGWKQYESDRFFLNSNRATVNDVENEIFNNYINYTNVLKGSVYNVCAETEFTFKNITSNQLQQKILQRCIEVRTPDENNSKDTHSDIKTPLIAVGIGIIVLVSLCILFVVYNKKCKQGGDHDYDMNKEEQAAEAGNGDHEMQPAEYGENENSNNEAGERDHLTPSTDDNVLDGGDD